ncbi:MAG: ester cyclase, partial [Dehalococcoidia bacterium]|nr:ester cyclase [Dehalococcoidia bacterium]
ATFYASFPDYQREYLTEVIGDDTVAFVHHYTATHTGPWFGIEPTGMRLDVTGCSVMKVRDGHFAEVQIFQPDLMGALRHQANIQLVERLVEAEDAGDVEAYAAIMAPDVEVWVNGVHTVSSRDGQRASLQAALRAFPDWHRQTLGIFVDGDTAVLRWRGSGTHSADWAGMPASGNHVEFHGTSTAEIVGGLMRRIWIDMDMAGVIRQMTSQEKHP